MFSSPPLRDLIWGLVSSQSVRSGKYSKNKDGRNYPSFLESRMIGGIYTTIRPHINLMRSLRERGELLTRDGATRISCCSGKADVPGSRVSGDYWEGRAAGEWRCDEKSSADLVPVEYPAL
jgi:hypothetical protein